MRAARRAARGDGVAGRDRVAARQRGRPAVVDDRPRDAVLDQCDRRLRHAVGIERARQRSGERGVVGQRDRRRRHLGAQRAAQRTAALGVQHPVQPDLAEELEQLADRVGREHDRVVAGVELDRLLAWRRPDRARRDLDDVDVVDRHARRGAPARAARRVAGRHLQAGVGHAVDRRGARARRDRRCHLAGRPDPERLEVGRADDVEDRRQRPAGQPRVQLRGLLVVAVVGAVRRPRREAGQRPLDAEPRRRLRRPAGAQRAIAQRVVVEPVRRCPAGRAVDETQDVDVEVVDMRRLRRSRAREARQQRALLGDRHLRVAVGERQRALRDGRGVQLLAHETPTWTDAKRAGAAPWLTAMICPGSPLPQFVRPHNCQHSREPTASSDPQNSGVTPA